MACSLCGSATSVSACFRLSTTNKNKRLLASKLRNLDGEKLFGIPCDPCDRNPVNKNEHRAASPQLSRAPKPSTLRSPPLGRKTAQKVQMRCSRRPSPCPCCCPCLCLAILFHDSQKPPALPPTGLPLLSPRLAPAPAALSLPPAPAPAASPPCSCLCPSPLAPAAPSPCPSETPDVFGGLQERLRPLPF